jgi:hypothetical protein
VQPELLHVPAQSYTLQPLELHEEPMSQAQEIQLDESQLPSHWVEPQASPQESVEQVSPWLEAQSPLPPGLWHAAP